MNIETRLDGDGNVDKITFSNHGRDSVLQVPLELVTPLYRAMKAYTDILYEPDNHINYKLADGRAFFVGV